MVAFPPNSSATAVTEHIRIQGIVQGVGFRPTVYRLATTLGLVGEVGNDGEGVWILVSGTAEQLDRFAQAIETECPPLASIDSMTRTVVPYSPRFAQFVIKASVSNAVDTVMPPDAATCPECLREIFDPLSRFYRYPFTNCTHCGPRLSLTRAIPYDRRNTSMAEFTLCPQCQQDYDAVENRRFHAQPIACPECGPRVWVEDQQGQRIDPGEADRDSLDTAVRLLQQGSIVAIKGLGGFHLACDATNEAAVSRLRQRKQRFHKPFAMMARDVAAIERYCTVTPAERQQLERPAAPILLLDRQAFEPAAAYLPLTTSLSSSTPLHKWIAPSVAPCQRTLGFMLPYTPLHHLLLHSLEYPIVLTSGNVSDEPQCIDNDDARERLKAIADVFLMHNRDIVNRVDDSVVRVLADQPQVLRRSRGYAPRPLRLPTGFEAAAPILAMGSELKNTFCYLHQGRALLSQHGGDLENTRTYNAYQHTLMLYQQLFEHMPEVIAVDQHPDYLSTKLGLDLAAHSPHDQGHPGSPKIQAVQHHHAHVAACMAENGIPLATRPVLGIALDGLGSGEDGTLWGGEFLLSDYQGFRRLGRFRPIALLGGEQAIRQPWRNTYAHLRSAFDWDELMSACGDLELIQFLSNKPQTLLEQMLEKEMHSPLASSVGRLFDAVAAAVGICCEEATYEGQGAVELEALIQPRHLEQAILYPFEANYLPEAALWELDPKPMWLALLSDMTRELTPALIATRFHLGLAEAIANLTDTLAQTYPFTQVALTGGVFQNKILTLELESRLVSRGFEVLQHHRVPPNDGGLSLGQAVVAAARQLVS